MLAHRTALRLAVGLPVALGLAPLAAQVPALATHFQGGFLDLSAYLAEHDTTVVVGTLEKLKDGKRERLKEGTDLGGAGTSVQVSGTVFYKQQISCVPKVDETLAGPAWKPKTTVHLEVQAATLPSGDQQRRLRAGTRAAVTEDLRALLVLRRGKQGHEVLDLLPADSSLDRGDTAASFAQRAGDVVAVSKRMLELRQACELADRLRAKAESVKPEALKPLQELLDVKVELRDPAHEAWVTQHCGPLERALRKKLDELPPKK